MTKTLVLCPGDACLAPIVIKTETVIRPNLANHGEPANGKRLSDRPTVEITLPRVDALDIRKLRKRFPEDRPRCRRV